MAEGIEGKLLIDGRPLPAAAGETFDVCSPWTGEVIGVAPRAGAADVEAAVVAARTGFQRWAGLPPGARELVLLQAADIIAREGEARFLDTLIDESGSTITKARGEIAYAVDLLRTAAGEARRLYGDTFPNDRNDRMSMVLREPLGVVAVLAPYNAPLSLTVKMAAFPLAVGNAVVLKPSEETPFTAMTFARILHEAGLPDSAINVLTGLPEECGAPLVSHPDVDCVALTGSTATGVRVGREAIGSMKRMQLELGGKSAIVVLRDADPADAAGIVADGMFAHAGQICMANSRIVVEAPVFDAFAEALKARLEAMPIGDPRDEASVYGPLINRHALDKVQAHQQDALSRGARLLTGGAIKEGLVYQPTVLVEPPRDSRVWREESFGPVASLVRADDFEAAIDIAHDCDYGLSAAVLTRDVKKAFDAARRIRAGSVHIGMHAFQSNALAPIGGFGLSGIGKSGGRYSTEEFTELKWVSVELEGAA
jgi:acyl-CoA reductase-like NAD-dependent aldehyde dehydrogenase